MSNTWKYPLELKRCLISVFLESSNEYEQVSTTLLTNEKKTITLACIPDHASAAIVQS